MKRVFLSLMLMVAFVGTPALATSTSEATTNTASTTEEVIEVPSRVGMFFRSMGERFRLLITMDEAEKAELQLQFAEEREAIAQALQERGELDRVERVADRAAALAERASERIARIGEQESERAERAIERLTQYQERLTERAARLEERAGDDAEELRARTAARLEQFASSSTRLMHAIENRNLSEEAKMRLEANRERMTSHLESVREMQETTKEIREEYEPGSDEMKDAMEEVRKEFREAAQETREAYQEQKEEIRKQRAKAANHNTTRSNRITPKAADTQNPLHRERAQTRQSALAE